MKDLLRTLQARFEKNAKRHPGLEWAKVQARLEANPKKLKALEAMEKTGGEPDVVGRDAKTGEVVFYDCAAESPAGRRSVCYDREGLESRKEHRPKDTAVDMAAAMGIQILTEEEYRELRPALRPRLHLPQRRVVLLRGPRIPRIAARLANIGQGVTADWSPPRLALHPAPIIMGAVNHARKERAQWGR